MKYKDPVNVFNGLKFKHETSEPSKEQMPNHLVAIKAYKNSQNIVKPFIKPISKIF